MATNVRRVVCSLAALGLLVAVGACDGAEDGGTTSTTAAAPSSTGTDGPTDAPSNLPLTEDAQEPATPPAWAFPVLVDGWQFSTRDQKGVNQLSRAGSEALFTSYQLTETGSTDDAADSKAWLEKYHATLSANAQLRKVTDPAYSTARIQSDHAMTIEFVQQDLTYLTAAGVRYKSRFLARSLGSYLMAVQYAAPEDQWSEAEWQELISSGLQLVLGW